LVNDLDHLQEDLYFERGKYPEGLRVQVNDVALTVAHLQRVGLKANNQQHLRRDFQEMDKKVHQLVRTLEQSGDPWLRRQATRLRYSDEQLHYAIHRKVQNSQESARELLARQAHLLDDAARDLRDLARRVDRRDRGLRDAIKEFSERTAHFHEVAEGQADRNHLREDFKAVDEAWRHVVDRLNRSASAYYLRAAAQNVDRVHHQVHDLTFAGQRTGNQPPASEPPRRVAIEFEIPGVGRFQIPQ
jgi:hypothetical protein